MQAFLRTEVESHLGIIAPLPDLCKGTLILGHFAPDPGCCSQMGEHSKYATLPWEIYIINNFTCDHYIFQQLYFGHGGFCSFHGGNCFVAVVFIAIIGIM